VAVTGLARLAALLFAPLFLTRFLGRGPDFWWWLSANIAVCALAGAWRNETFLSDLREDLADAPWRKVLYGVLSAAILYLVFFAGNELSRRLFPWAGAGIDGVYAFRGGASALRIGLLMALVIGPGEELLWRVLLQGGFEAKHGRGRAFLAAAALYTGVHLFSFNPMLILAAAVCGAFWGMLYLLFRSPLLNIVSHTLWDIAVFLIFPFS
jgi:membrane protease YdiL (CAAX protease family)